MPALRKENQRTIFYLRGEHILTSKPTSSTSQSESERDEKEKNVRTKYVNFMT